MWLLIAIIAQSILGTAGVFDKLLLRRRVPDPIVYAFWFGMLGMFALLLAPFGLAMLPLDILSISLMSGVTFVFSLLLLFVVLAKTEASVALPLTAVFISLFTLAITPVFIGMPLSGMDIIGIALLVLGAIIFFLSEKKQLHLPIILLILASSFFYSVSVVLQKFVFEHSSFVTGFVWTKIGGVLFSIMLLSVNQWRERIRTISARISRPNRTWYMANRAWASVGSVLLSFAVFLAHPALVESTHSFRYVAVFLASWFILRERSHGKILAAKIIATCCIVIGLLWLGVTAYARSIPIDVNRTITWGVTFSEKFSRRLGLDPKENLHAILHDLHPKNIRLVAYWDEIEPSKSVFDFSSLDWQLDETARAHTQVALAIGMKVPRWPECFVPAWALGLSAKDRDDAVRSYIAEIIKRYRGRPEIAMWQVENEPFLTFGFCPGRENNALEQEISLVHSLDNRPVLITDSGEFGTWYRAAKLGDVFGTSLYRKVYSPSVGRYIGELDYPFNPSFFRLKEKVIRFLLHDYTKPFVVIELQAEPWGNVEIPLLSLDDQVSLFTPDYLKETIEYAKETGFGEYYMWGAEWWYMMGVKYNNWAYWNEARKVIQAY